MKCVKKTGKSQKRHGHAPFSGGGSSVAQKIQRGATNESCKARKSSGSNWCYFYVFTVKNAFLLFCFAKIQRGARNESCKARKSSGNIWCYFLGKVKNAIFTVKNAFSVKGGHKCPVRLFFCCCQNPEGGYKQKVSKCP